MDIIQIEKSYSKANGVGAWHEIDIETVPLAKDSRLYFFHYFNIVHPIWQDGKYIYIVWKNYRTDANAFWQRYHVSDLNVYYSYNSTFYEWSIPLKISRKLQLYLRHDQADTLTFTVFLEVYSFKSIEEFFEYVG